MNAWDPCTTEHTPWLHWIECHPGLGGYIQAVGVVGTLALALLGPPIARLFVRLRERWAQRVATISVARQLRKSVNELIERIDGRLATIGTYSEPDPQYLSLFLNNIKLVIPGALDMTPYGSGFYDSERLLFLQRLLEQARGYNYFLAGKEQNGIRDGEWGMLRDQARCALVDLRECATQACSTIDAM